MIEVKHVKGVRTFAGAQPASWCGLDVVRDLPELTQSSSSHRGTEAYVVVRQIQMRGVTGQVSRDLRKKV